MSSDIDAISLVVYGARNAPDDIVLFQYHDAMRGPSQQFICCRQTGGAGSDDDYCGISHASFTLT